MRELLIDARLIAIKDLRIEARSRVLLNQVAPFALLVLVLFGFALDADQRTLRSFAPGLFWVAVLLAALLAVQRSTSLERADDAQTGLRLSGMAPSSVFLGKAAAVFLQLAVLEVLLT
ncbi:MAG: heme exporter protein CcmB, partial [Acidimicrobiales bacterium]|nr:heme exporter protein CcmB [Acidimicrobiales bacterium]